MSEIPEIQKSTEDAPVKQKRKRETSLSFKHWLTRTIIIGIVLTTVIFILEYVFHITILVQTLVALTTALLIGLVHEALHYYKAVKLGYKVTWFRGRFTMGFTIEHGSIRGKETPEKQKIKQDIKSIAHFPYYILVPLSIGILLLGCYMFIYYNSLWGLLPGSMISLIFHGLMFSKEGNSI